MSLATGWVHVNSSDPRLIIEATRRDENAAETEPIRTADRGSAELEESDPAASESNREQQVEVKMARGVTIDHVAVPPAPETGAHNGDHAQRSDEPEAVEDSDQERLQSYDATPTKASVADSAEDCDEQEEEHVKDNGDLLDSSSVLPVHLDPSPIGGSEAGAFIDSTGRVVELPVVDLELAAQGSRLRKERMRLEARAASPASRGAV